MRLVVDFLIALIVLVVLGTILVQQRARADQIGLIEETQRAMHAIESRAIFHAGLGDAALTRRGYPMSIDEVWFERLPVNALTGPTIVWIEVTPATDTKAYNPPQITTDSGRAGFWYNPYRGIVRARVPMQTSEQATVELYNMVNGTTLRETDVGWLNDR